MPIFVECYGGETAAIVLPLTSNDLPLATQTFEKVELVVSGLDGHLAATVVTDTQRIYFNDAAGHLVYWPLISEIFPGGSPFRLYARVYADGVHWVSVPHGDYYLLDVRDPLT